MTRNGAAHRQATPCSTTALQQQGRRPVQTSSHQEAPPRINRLPDADDRIAMGADFLRHIRRNLDELAELLEKARSGNPRAIRYFAWRATDVCKGFVWELNEGTIVDDIEAALDYERRQRSA